MNQYLIELNKLPPALGYPVGILLVGLCYLFGYGLYRIIKEMK